MKCSCLLPAVALIGMNLWATCPTPQGPLSWGTSGSYGYSFHEGVGGPAPDALDPELWSGLYGGQSDVETGASGWNYANVVNGTYIQFYSSSGNTDLEFFAYWVNYPGNPYSDPGAAAITMEAYYDGSNIIAEAKTTFYFNSTGQYTTVSLSFSDDGYDAFMTKTTLHEIGHTMGLADNPLAPAGQSVMNLQNGTNDSGNNMPSAVTSCDNSSVW